MKFNAGILGVVIVVLALMGTVVSGYALNVTPIERTATSYEYVTDVSGLFDYSEQSDFTPYSPAKNLTGYNLLDGSASGVEYTPATVANQYLMKTSESSTSATISMTTFSNDTTITPPNGGNYAWQYENNTATSGYNDHIVVLNPSIVKMSAFISKLATGMPEGTTSITFTLNSPTYTAEGTNTNLVGLLYNAQTWASGSPTVTYNGTTYAMNIWPSYDVGGIYTTTYKPTYTYDVASGTVTYPNANGSGSVVIVPDNYYVLWGTNVVKQRYDVGHPFDAPTVTAPVWTPTNNIYVTYSSTTYEYLNPSAGIKPTPDTAANPTVWSNGYGNGIVDIVVNNGGQKYIYFEMVYRDEPNHVHLCLESDRIDSFYGDNATIPVWDYVLLRIDAINGTATVYPVTNFVNYTQYAAASYSLATVNLSNKGVIDEIRIRPTSSIYGEMPTITVSATTVTMTKKLLMVNPSLDITAAFPETATSGYRLNFYSFVTYGDQVTINGTAYPVENGRITVDNVKHNLRNIYVEYKPSDGHVYLVFADEKKTIDLGEKTTNTVSMSGTWYFTTGFWNGKVSTETVYESSWANALTGTQSLLIFLGLLVLGVVIGWKYLNLKFLDLAIIAGAAVIIISLLEVIA